MVVRADRHAAGRDEHVDVAQCGAQDGDGRVEVVADAHAGRQLAAGAVHGATQRRAVGVADAAGEQGLAGIGQLVAGAGERDARAAHDARARDVQRCQHAELGRSEQRAGVDDELAGADVLPRRADVQVLLDDPVDDDRAVVLVDRGELLLGDRIGAVG